MNIPHHQKEDDFSYGSSGLTRFIVSLATILGSIFFITALLINIPINDRLELLAFVMATSGMSTTIFAYLLYRNRLLQRLGRLRWALLITSVLTMGIILINIWILAELMFVDNHYISLTSLVLVFAGLTALSFNVFISKAITDRLNELTKGVNRLADGDLSTRLAIDGNDEIAQLTYGFNQMAYSLQTAAEQKKLLEQTRRDLVAWVSHDLRTPLTSMRVMLEALHDGIITDQSTQKRYIQNSLSEIEHLSHLIEDLFEMAQLDVGHINLDYEKTSLPDLISDTISTMMVNAKQKSITLTGWVEPDINFIELAPDKMQRVLYNIVSNAILYAPDGEKIDIHVQRVTANRIQINIHNTGTLIDAEILPHIFENFYRGEDSRKRNEDNTRGTGLGLAIARAFIEAHQGTIWADSSKEKGTIFCIQIPEKPSKATQSSK